ncbi:FG-GAP-like repeat-containing protein [Streptomyces violascens]|uniref:FG-GAP-like repeat-containing protein n=1 Tax=Streptomyces violascens TaxID=67381 RepID=UPI00365425F2
MRIRSAVAVAAAVGIATGFLPLTAGAAYAAPVPGELTIPADRRLNPDEGILVGSGETGYLWGQQDSTYNWTSYVDGSVKPVPVPDGTGTAAATGGDYVVFSATTPPKIVQRNMKDGSERTATLAPGQSFAGAFGDVVLTSDSTAALHVLTWDDGQFQDRAVTGIPAGTTLLRVSDTGSRDGALVQARVGGSSAKPTMLWVDRSGRARATAVPDVGAVSNVNGDRFAAWNEAMDRVQVWDVADLSRPVQEVTIGKSGGLDLIGVVGDSLLFARGTFWDSQNVFAVPLAGGAEQLVVDKAMGVGAFTPDGTLLIGRNDPAAGPLMVTIRPGADGRFSATTAPRPPVGHMAAVGLSLAQGRLSTVEKGPWTSTELRGTDLTVSGALRAGERVGRGSDADLFHDCATSQCPDMQATGDGGLVFQGTDDSSARVLDERRYLPGTRAVPKSAYQQPDAPVQVSGRYAFAGGGPFPSWLEVFDLDTWKPVSLGPRVTGDKPQAYALNGSTLWLETGTGSAEAVDVRTGKTLATAKVSDCDITSLQANGTNLLWECGSSASGVYDTAARRNVALPAHQSARLGDGYVAWQQGGVLSVTDVRGASGTRALGTPKRGEPGKGWAVDRFGGPVAYTDAEEAVHVVPAGIPASALSVLDTDTSARANANSGPWAPRWWLNKPAASWQLTLKNSAGATVRTLTGGEARGLVKPAWDGKADGGQYAANGAYAWTLTVTPADGQGAALTRTGTVGLTGGAPVARDFVGAGGPDGRADLLALTPSGRFDLRTGPGVTGEAQAQGEGWTGANALTAAIPYRDVNGDRCNDVLVRMASGELRAYTPACGAPLTPSTAYQSLGRGWNAYDTLVSPGDVDGDGRADLVARTSGGDLYVYSDNGALGFKEPVKAGWGWGGLLVVGAGDLTGDGKGDLLARDASGVLWTYPGNGKGGFADRIRLGAGWGGFDALVGAGDLDGDGRPDLLAREKSGTLWLYPGAGNGAFGERKLLGGGWNMYKSLY